MRIISIVLATLIAGSLVTPAAAKQYPIYHNGEIVGYRGSSSSSYSGVSQGSTQGRTPHQIVRAEQYRELVFDRCSLQNNDQDLNRQASRNADVIVGAGSRWLAGAIFGKKNVNRHRYDSYRYDNYQPSYENRRDCRETADQAYYEMLNSAPAASCQRVMTAVRDRNGNVVSQQVNEECSSNRAEDWDTSLRYDQQGQ